jgi:hypothetical protein
MAHLGFKPCCANPDVWMRPAMKPADGHHYFEYVLSYSDNCLVISHRQESVLQDKIGKYFDLKGESIGAPDIYLGGKLHEEKLTNGNKAWAFGSSQYVKAAVDYVEKYLGDEQNLTLPAKANTPLKTDYCPELDVTAELLPQDALHFQSLIGVLRWIVELGGVDICCELSMLSSHLALPCEGHLHALYNMFAYLKSHHNA